MDEPIFKEDFKNFDFDGKSFVELDVPDAVKNLAEGSISICFKADDVPAKRTIRPLFHYGSKRRCPAHFDANNRGFVVELAHDPVKPGVRSIFFTVFTDKGGCDYRYPALCFDSRDPIPENKWQHFVAVVGTDKSKVDERNKENNPKGEFNTGYLNGKELINRRYNFGSARCETPDRRGERGQTCHQFFQDSTLLENESPTIWIGKGFWGSAGIPNPEVFFDGKIGEVQIYDRPITADEAKTLATACLAKK